MTQQKHSVRALPSSRDARASTSTFEGRTHECAASASSTLSWSVRSAGQARTFVEEQTCPLHGSQAVPAVALVASELVTHALRGSGPLTIALTCDVVSVTLSLSYPTDAPVESDRLQRGDAVSSMIVDSICRASGTERYEHGSVMWCTIPTGHMPQAPTYGKSVVA